MTTDVEKKFVDVCLSDLLPCSCSLKGFRWCVERWGDSVRVCCRFSDVRILEDAIREGVSHG